MVVNVTGGDRERGKIIIKEWKGGEVRGTKNRESKGIREADINIFFIMAGPLIGGGGKNLQIIQNMKNENIN